MARCVLMQYTLAFDSSMKAADFERTMDLPAVAFFKVRHRVPRPTGFPVEDAETSCSAVHGLGVLLRGTCHVQDGQLKQIVHPIVVPRDEAQKKARALLRKTARRWIAG